MAKFTEIPWFTIENYIYDVLNPSEASTYSHASGGTFLRPNAILITTNTNPFQLYSKSDETDYKPVKATITENWNDNENEIKLEKLLSRTVSPSLNILRTVSTSGFGYHNITYDYLTDEYKYDIENADSMYIRKDSVFHDWLNTNWDDYDGYFNKNKLFLYFGKGYNRNENDNEYIIIHHYTLKDWIQNALPPNNRNDTLNEFLFLIYDQLYHKVYETQKDIWSLIDPYEINEDLIDNLFEYYNETPLTSDIDIYKRRVYVDNLIYWLKKKGTYSSLFVIWYTLAKDTTNELKVYDRWHTPSPSGDLIDSFVDYDYTESYGGVYPSEYSVADNNILSTHYKVEFEFDNNPFGSDILAEKFIDNLYNTWESTRPITRFSHYHMIGTITTDFSGNFIQLWNNPIYDANIYTASTSFTEAASGSAIHIQSTPKTTWEIIHDLDTTDVLVHIYDLSLNRMLSKDIEVYNNSTIRIYFEYNTSGSVFITKASMTRNQDFVLNDWTINHLLNNQYVLSQFYQDTYLQRPDTVTATSNNVLDMTSLGLSGYGVVKKSNYTHTQLTASDTWTITHNLDYIGVMLDIYDHNDEKVLPDTITLLNKNSCTITFSTPLSGYCGVIPAGNPGLGDVSSKFTGIWDVKLGNGEDLNSWNYLSENDLKNTFYTLSTSGNVTPDDDGITLTFSIPKNISGNITEIGIFNNESDLFLVSIINNIYKHEDIMMDVTYYAQYENI